MIAAGLLFHLLGGLGVFLLGIEVLWFVSVYRDKDSLGEQE